MIGKRYTAQQWIHAALAGYRDAAGREALAQDMLAEGFDPQVCIPALLTAIAAGQSPEAAVVSVKTRYAPTAQARLSAMRRTALSNLVCSALSSGVR